jgi:hypothetical protein
MVNACLLVKVAKSPDGTTVYHVTEKGIRYAGIEDRVKEEQKYENFMSHYEKR